MKDPAYLFYSQDFYTGVATMNFEDRGKYISLLCLMHQQGRMSEETIRFVVGSVSVSLKSKFKVDENGLWYNERLEKEIEKRKNFLESRVNNGKLGGRPKKDKKPLGKPNGKPLGKAKQNLIEDDNENENESINKIVYPFDSENFKKVWNFWKKYKHEEHKFQYKTYLSEQAALKKLGELSGHDEQVAIRIIEQSLANGWQGFFELNNTEHGKKSITGMQGSMQDIIDQRERRRAQGAQGG